MQERFLLFFYDFYNQPVAGAVLKYGKKTHSPTVQLIMQMKSPTGGNHDEKGNYHNSFHNNVNYFGRVHNLLYL